MTTTTQIQGACDPRFVAVREAFAEDLAKRGDVGAAVCVYVDGQPVVDLWGGYADAARTRPWGRETMACVRSTTKGMVAICAHMLVERGLLDLDAPVARYWPEFAQGGKAHIPVRWLLSHRAGLPAIRRDMLRDPTSMAARAFLNPPRAPGDMNTRAWRAAEIPSSNGHTTARALARIYGTLAHGGTLDGVHLLHPATVEAAIVEESCGPDAILPYPTRFGLGFMLTMQERPFGPHPRAFGHLGRGGSIGFADPDGRIGFGYVMNQYQTGTLRNPDLRWPTLVQAVYASLGAQ